MRQVFSMYGPHRMAKISSVLNSKKLLKLFPLKSNVGNYSSWGITDLSTKSTILRPFTYLLWIILRPQKEWFCIRLQSSVNLLPPF